MLDQIVSSGRKLVTIIDPHIKKEEAYTFYEDSLSLKLAVTDKWGIPYESQCWPNTSIWLDYANPAARDYLVRYY